MVFDFLRQVLQVRDRLCLNWIRHSSEAKERGNFPSVPNLDAALFLHAVLAQQPQRSTDQTEMPGYRAKAIQALQLLRGIMSQFSQEKRLALQQLQQAHVLVSRHLIQLFKHMDICRTWAARRGVLMITLRHPEALFLDPAYLRRFTLLCALQQANGRADKRLPAIVHVCVEEKGRGVSSSSLLYACTPNADAENPDIFPSVMRRLVLGGRPAHAKRRRGGVGEIARRQRGEEREGGGRRNTERRRTRAGGNLEGEESDIEVGESEESTVFSSEDEDGRGRRRTGRESRGNITREDGRRHDGIIQGRNGSSTQQRQQQYDEREKLSNIVELDAACVNLIRVRVQRLAADVQKQLAALYSEEIRRIRTAEEDEEEGDETQEQHGEEEEEVLQEEDEEEEDDEKEEEEAENSEEAEEEEESEENEEEAEEDNEGENQVEDDAATEERTSLREGKNRNRRRKRSETGTDERCKRDRRRDTSGDDDRLEEPSGQKEAGENPDDNKFNGDKESQDAAEATQRSEEESEA